jgi:hypothetical protein
MTASKGLFEKYLNHIFIETGSNKGDGIWQALHEGFKVIYSVEIVPEYYNQCLIRFKKFPQVHLVLGDSVTFLKALMKVIDEPVTFWLDAHVGAESTPIMEELEIIKNHPIKTHTILIDDMRDWKVRVNKVSPEILRNKVMEINPDYKITFEMGWKPKDILVASI